MALINTDDSNAQQHGGVNCVVLVDGVAYSMTPYGLLQPHWRVIKRHPQTGNMIGIGKVYPSHTDMIVPMITQIEPNTTSPQLVRGEIDNNHTYVTTDTLTPGPHPLPQQCPFCLKPLLFHQVHQTLVCTLFSCPGRLAARIKHLFLEQLDGLQHVTPNTIDEIVLHYGIIRDMKQMFDILEMSELFCEPNHHHNEDSTFSGELDSLVKIVEGLLVAIDETRQPTIHENYADLLLGGLCYPGVTPAVVKRLMLAARYAKTDMFSFTLEAFSDLPYLRTILTQEQYAGVVSDQSSWLDEYSFIVNQIVNNSKAFGGI